MMRYKIIVTNQFKKDLKRILRRGLKTALLNTVVERLANGETLEEKYRDHELTGNWIGFRECHITPDWLLIYMKQDELLVLTLSKTGSHSDLF